MKKIVDFLKISWYNKYRSGALAQLGARLTGSQEVRGSIPLCSTMNRNGHLAVPFFICR